MSTILVPVDFSLPSHKALQYALNMMDKEVDKMILFHVYALPIPNQDMPSMMLQDLMISYREIAEQQIAKMVEKIRLEYGDAVDISGKTVPGSPVRGILDEVEQTHIDLIVMGMHGKNKLLRKVMGTTATRVIQQTQVPVVVVPEDAVYTDIKKIVYASNFEQEDILALDRVIKLASSLNAEVRCVHVKTLDEGIDKYKKDLLQSAFQTRGELEPIEIDMIANSNLIEGLNRYIEFYEIDVIVMLTHPKSIFNRILEGSNTWDMAFQSKIPVWVFQTKQEETNPVAKAENILN